ncbi:uncharacterized protein LOC129788248 isoform X2 [Lutzomyia longipalpis]|uniref:uncharacterized protein LOC129788248 isoform X2 n=1 Tax=Lutzomyia longipalpis TaxID=7200 RepID=UPI0024842359|nr:uncharacterized protein LOC129788248 isoform X2 [Lutzomyia longipalpis]
MSGGSNIASVAMESPLPEQVEESKMTSIALRNKTDPDTSYGQHFLLQNDFMFIDEDGDEVDSGYGTNNRILFDAERNTALSEQKNSQNSNNLSQQRLQAKAQEKEKAEEERTKEHHSDRRLQDVEKKENSVDAQRTAKIADIPLNCDSVCGEKVANDKMARGKLQEEVPDEDPYAELELYLERVKKEINDVFEQLNHKTHSAKDGVFPHTNNTEANNVERRRDNKLQNEVRLMKSDDLVIKEAEDPAEIVKTRDQREKRCDHTTRKNELRSMETSILPYPKDGERAMINEWADSVMREFDELVEGEKKPAPAVNRRHHQQWHDAPHSAADHLHLKRSSDNLVNGRAGSDSSSPILGYSKVSVDSEATVLKIDEGIDEKREISTQTSPKLHSIKKEVSPDAWTSEESILRGTDTVDEDNKSTSSSAGEDISAALSSGKSGNSLNSSVDDSAESGLGTASSVHGSGYRKIRPYLHQISQKSIDDKNAWIRYENATTQTGKMRPSLKLIENASFVSTDDPDLLEVLSLYDDNNADDDEFAISDSETSSKYQEDSCTENTKLDKGLPQSMSRKIPEENDEEVMLRRKASGPQCDIAKNVKCLDRLGTLVSYTPNGGACKTINNTSVVPEKQCNSLPFTRRVAKERHFPPTPPSIENESDSALPAINRRPFCLPMSQESFHTISQLPSPSTTSLHSGGNRRSALLIQELTTKSNSAPLLMKKENKRDAFTDQTASLRYSRSQSDRYLAEIEAIEACKWLRAAGFPQYAQMYEDLQFPIDLSNVAQDHPFLENDPLQSLYRRLVALNRCATMRLDGTHKHGTNDDSDDDSCALSENWTFQPQSRRWSRVGEMDMPPPPVKGDKNKDKLNISSRESSPESTDAFDYCGGPQSGGFSDQEMIQSKFRRTGSERLRDGAKAFLRRVESIKSKRRKRQNKEGVIISGPQVLDFSQMNQKMSDLKCVDVFSHPCSPVPTSPTVMSPKHLFVNTNELRLPFTDPNRLSPKHAMGKKTHHYRSLSNRTSPLPFMGQTSSKSGDDSSSYCSDTNSQDSVTIRVGRKKPNRARRFFQRGSKVEDAGALSDSECHPGKNKYFKDTSVSGKESKSSKLARGGSLNLGKESDKYRDAFQKRSLRSRSTIRKQERKTDSDSKDEEVILRSNRGPVVRWHSFQTAEKPEMKSLLRPLSSQPSKKRESGIQFAALSCGQFQVIRKLALVTLTGHMERYCPTHRTGWNWELPKFIKKIKTPDYKDKKVFGVPLLLVLQRTGHSLPTPIQQALKWLKANALDQVGLFRKSGVKSRIFKIKGMVENAKESELVTLFDGQQAYDVADMVKQYFRELPESLLTSKMSETFIAIFQHLPPEVRPDAVQYAVLLLPDENREVLYTLIVFLNQVSECSMFNQMTANNLAVCLAPSIFHGGIISPRSNSVSPRRRKPAGLPDPRELCETKASHECLTYLIQNYRTVFTFSNEKMQRCKFSHFDESRPVTLNTLGEDIQLHDWRGYLYECTTAAMKEGREKSRGWISSPSLDPHVDIAYKKIGDGHPLRLWKCTVEVEAPPTEVLHHIVKERHLWDTDLLKWRVIEQLDEKSEIFQYVCGGQSITDYCVVRSWNTELPRGACVIVETSVEHQDATLLLLGGVRGVVLASRYLIEPCGSGKSRIVHLARVDAKGRTPEWYNKSYGHICSHYLSAIRNFFKHVTQGPESKV